MPLCESQLFALEITRVGDSAPRERAYSPTAKRTRRVPGQRQRALALVGEVGERRQERQGLEVLARDELRHPEHLSLGVLRLALQRERARVGGSEIDPDRPARRSERSQLDLRLGDHGEVSATDANRKRELLDAPAAVPQNSAKRRAAAHVPGELERNRIGILEGHRGALALAPHGLDARVLGERFAAALVHDARGGADLGVREGGDVLLHEIDEAPVALEEREELERTVVRIGELGPSDRRGLGRSPFRGSRVGRLLLGKLRLRVAAPRRSP